MPRSLPCPLCGPMPTGRMRALALRACETARAVVAGHGCAAEHPARRVSLLIGVASAHGSADASARLALADQRLCEAKRAGKDRVVAAG